MYKKEVLQNGIAPQWYDERKTNFFPSSQEHACK
jgi:hypothetical protein